MAVALVARARGAGARREPGHPAKGIRTTELTIPEFWPRCGCPSEVAVTRSYCHCTSDPTLPVCDLLYVPATVPGWVLTSESRRSMAPRRAATSRRCAVNAAEQASLMARRPSGISFAGAGQACGASSAPLKLHRMRRQPWRLGLTCDLPGGPEWGPRTEDDRRRLVRQMRG